MKLVITKRNTIYYAKQEKIFPFWIQDVIQLCPKEKIKFFDLD